MPSIIHRSPVAWHSVRNRRFGSISGSSSTAVVCQNVPPITVVAPGSVIPRPTRASWVSAPPITTGVPGARPASRAAASVTSPATVPGSSTGGSVAASTPHRALSSGDHARRARSNIAELDPTDGSVMWRPVSRYTIQSLSMPSMATRAKSSGSWRASHRSRGGAVIATQSPPTA
jgi:hypothetical protein